MAVITVKPSLRLMYKEGGLYLLGRTRALQTLPWSRILELKSEPSKRGQFCKLVSPSCGLHFRGKEQEVIEGIISSLIVHLVKRTCSSLNEDVIFINRSIKSLNDFHFSGDVTFIDVTFIDDNSQFCIQCLIRKLASEAYIEQCVVFSVSQRISVVAESLLFSDPFDAAFPSMHECMFLM
ncbi:hypothetical protein Patl1_14544 [Pistacia atlantica]|uniref:Uncharacterized protein n=1 Tax=Pistacia atlantica TaxID=434234 RepID=A0ACC1AUG6_9ROSI|nr:hypothetical protein Patl1_14544 [Pistacia atlantica]